MTDDRAPVLVGVGELVRRPDDASPRTDPGAMMADAVRLALADAGAGDAPLRRIGAIAAAPSAGWPDRDPGARVRELLGAGAHVRTLRSSMQGGNGPQLLVNLLAGRIAGGQLDAAVVCSAEALSSVAQASKGELVLDWPQPGGDGDGEVVEGEGTPPNTEEETAVGVIAPIMAYPLIENALMHAAGRTPQQQLALVSELWARFSEVAAGQPAAWTPVAHTPAQLAAGGPANRRVSFPYRKLHNANIQVDQAAALILTSNGVADALGIAPDRRVFVHAGAHAADEWFLSHRPDLHRSPAIAACGRALREHAGAGPEDLAHVDLYSCFPAAVELAAAELGLGLDRRLTCTGGLTFFGGPGNGYATHGIAAVARALRAGEPGELGLATALGWYATKHALGLYGNEPPARPYRSLAPDPGLPAPVAVAEPAARRATAETCTVIYERDGRPSYGVLFARLKDGRRVLGRTHDAGVMEAMTADRFLGSPVAMKGDRSFEPS